MASSSISPEEKIQSLHQRSRSWWLWTVKGWVLWMQCREGRQLIATPTWRRWQKSGSVSHEFGLTRIQQKSCFSMTMQGRTQAWRLRKPSQNLVRQNHPIHPTSPISHRQISNYLELWRIQSAVRSMRLTMWFAQWELGYANRTRHCTDKAQRHTRSSLAQARRSGRKLCGKIGYGVKLSSAV
jgi:hypothetical protein